MTQKDVANTIRIALATEHLDTPLPDVIEGLLRSTVALWGAAHDLSIDDCEDMLLDLSAVITGQHIGSDDSDPSAMINGLPAKGRN
jgi:hypothetical protein